MPTYETRARSSPSTLRSSTHRSRPRTVVRSRRSLARAAADLGHFEVFTEEIAIVDGIAIKLVRPADEDAVVDYYVSLGQLDADPYWATLWPSALAVSRYIANAPSLVRGKTVYDLGAGLGLSGLVACAAGARKVVLLDREPLALACAELSIEANGFQDRVSVEVFDWNAIETQEKFDTLLACDVLYEVQAVSPIAELVPRLVRSGGGRFLLGDPPLRAPKNRERFKSLLTEQYGAFMMREVTVRETNDALILMDFKL
ncbi:Nicotinamide N-methyltransferase-like [Ostreococcus tauri]|uniref:Nicotinamide N-methyltransferase-like n=1 Tax=Ostreococcus tauri TaxID=70448 RepID=Q01A27_OSTTA|nr:Nicotinamide N-methyltransferase-like [Ostreococcus tauri]CAL51972.1 Nicotinamide N-methyltransferase-like [Ostreococcus tauri]|eukprot:XP_003079091.1 Nicotinamide N-methyltransferase-like [Ostreococcus tauri]